MAVKAILLGGIGTLVECADLDRDAWNAAFRAHGLNWDWSWDTYSELMRPGGDRNLAERFAAHMGQSLDAARLDATHIRLFSARISDGVPLRAGVAELFAAAARRNISLGLVSRADAGVVHALLAATLRARGGLEFDAVISRADAERLAPHPDGMLLALDRLGCAPGDAVAITDTPAAAAAALDAGLRVQAYPGLLAEDQTFPEGCEMMGEILPELLFNPATSAARTAAE